jgi:hypothetical protein
MAGDLSVAILFERQESSSPTPQDDRVVFLMETDRSKRIFTSRTPFRMTELFYFVQRKHERNRRPPFADSGWDVQELRSAGEIDQSLGRLVGLKTVTTREHPRAQAEAYATVPKEGFFCSDFGNLGDMGRSGAASLRREPGYLCQFYQGWTLGMV